MRNNSKIKFKQKQTKIYNNYYFKDKKKLMKII